MKLLILGAGGHGHVVKEIAEAMRDTNQKPYYETIDFLDDNSSEAVGTLSELSFFVGSYEEAFAAIGKDSLRLEWIQKIKEAGYRMPVLIHPTAYVSPSAKLGAGTVVEPMAAVNTGAVIGEGGILSMGALVDHNTVIGSGVHISCGTTVKADCEIQGPTTVPSGMVVTKEMRQTLGQSKERRDTGKEKVGDRR